MLGGFLPFSKKKKKREMKKCPSSVTYTDEVGSLSFPSGLSSRDRISIGFGSFENLGSGSAMRIREKNSYDGENLPEKGRGLKLEEWKEAWGDRYILGKWV